MTITSIHGRRFGLKRIGAALSNLVMHGREVLTPLSVDVTVSTAQILALNGTPVSLVAAPGTGRTLILAGAYFFYDYNSAAYAGIAAGEDMAIRYTDGSGAIAATLEADGFLTLTADAYRWITPGAAPAATAGGIAPVTNAALVLHMTTGEITTGNSPLYVRTYYYDIATAQPAPTL